MSGLKSIIKGAISLFRNRGEAVAPGQNNLLPEHNHSFSQCGEDLIVKYIFQLRGIQHPSYIDIGCNDPYFLSNTALFYAEGSRGINIDANPDLIQKFEAARPDDINLNVGVGPVPGVMNFYILNDPTLSTFSKEEVDNVTNQGRYHLSQTIKVEIQTIDNIIQKSGFATFPDFMSLDVEGLDYEILMSFDFKKYRPKVICVESAEYSPIGAGKRKDELIDYVASMGYYEYANTNLNAILIDKAFWFI